MSRFQYRLLADTSPGRTKFGSVESAMLCARPMPDSSIPPHQTGMPFAIAHIVNSFCFEEAADAPELDVDDAARLQTIACSAWWAKRMHSSRQIGVSQATLQYGMVNDVVVSQGLLDHHQIELVQPLQVLHVRESIG